VLHYVLDPFPWLLMAVYDLYHAQQKLFDEENSDAATTTSWLSRLSSATTSATSGESAVEEPVKQPDSNAEKENPEKAKANKKASAVDDTTSSDGKTSHE
jgi:hypothetical protein